jgi:hypothetical protein
MESGETGFRPPWFQGIQSAGDNELRASARSAFGSPFTGQSILRRFISVANPNRLRVGRPIFDARNLVGSFNLKTADNHHEIQETHKKRRS